MKIICNRESLLRACQIVAGAIPSKEVKPVLSNIKIEADDDSCTLQATDLEMGIRLTLRGAKIDAEGAVLLPASRAMSAIREMPDEEITLEAGEKLAIIGARSKFEMPLQPVADFPAIPAFDATAHHEIKGKLLVDAIQRTIFAVGTDAKFSASSGVCIEANGNFALVATNGRMLAYAPAQAAMVGEHEDKRRGVVPPKFLDSLTKVVEPDETVKLCVGQSEAIAKTERAEIYTRLIEGRFLAYETHLKMKFANKTSVNVGAFLSCIRQAATMTDDLSAQIAIRFEKKRASFAANTVLGSAGIEMPIEFGDNWSANYMPKILIAPLSRLEPDSMVDFEFGDGEKPAFLRQVDYVCVVVPCAESKK